MHQKRSKRLWAMRLHCATRARKKKQLMCLKCVCVCVCVCVSKLFELAKDKTLKVVEKVKLFCTTLYLILYMFELLRNIMGTKVNNKVEMCKRNKKGKQK